MSFRSFLSLFSFSVAGKGKNKREMAAILAALDQSHAVIEFKVNGTIITANENFLATVGYSLDEIKGKHHSIFVSPEEKNSPAYTAFWQELGQGHFQIRQFKRYTKEGREI